MSKLRRLSTHLILRGRMVLKKRRTQRYLADLIGIVAKAIYHNHKRTLLNWPVRVAKPLNPVIELR